MTDNWHQTLPTSPLTGSGVELRKYRAASWAVKAIVCVEGLAYDWTTTRTAPTIEKDMKVA